jgi:hypothetical protein
MRGDLDSDTCDKAKTMDHILYGCTLLFTTHMAPPWRNPNIISQHTVSVSNWASIYMIIVFSLVVPRAMWYCFLRTGVHL